MRRTTAAIRSSTEYRGADFVVKVTYKALRGKVLAWTADETAEDALYRAALDKDVPLTLALVTAIIPRAIELGLATRVDRADGSGTLTWPEEPPSVVNARAEAEKAREAEETARDEALPTGPRGGKHTNLRSKGYRRRKKARERAAREAATRDAASAAPPRVTETVTGSVTPSAPSTRDAAPSVRAPAPTSPSLQPLEGLEAKGGGARGGASPKITAQPVTEPAVRGKDPPWRRTPAQLGTLDDQEIGTVAYNAWGSSIAPPTVFKKGEGGAARRTLGALLRAAQASEHDLHVIAWHWQKDGGREARARLTAAGVAVPVTPEALTLAIVTSELQLSRAWWATLTPDLQRGIERGQRPLVIEQPRLNIPDNETDPPAMAPASIELGPGLARTDERHVADEATEAAETG